MKTIHVVAAVICDSFENKSRIFATARGYGDLKGGWEFPGGKGKSRFSKRNRGRVVRQLAAFLCTTLPCAAGFNISRSFKLATDGSEP